MGDRIRLLYRDRQGFRLYQKLRERGRFPWPSAKVDTVLMTSAQLPLLLEGIDWRRSDWGAFARACRGILRPHLRYSYGVWA